MHINLSFDILGDCVLCFFEKEGQVKVSNEWVWFWVSFEYEKECGDEIAAVAPVSLAHTCSLLSRGVADLLATVWTSSPRHQLTHIFDLTLWSGPYLFPSVS